MLCRIGSRAPDYAAEIISEIERLAYPLGEALAFSDVPHLIGLSQSDAEDRLIMKTMTRTRTILVRLRIGADTDLGQLRDYWSMNSVRTDSVSILEGLVLSGGQEEIDITHLLPPLPRRLLYTFPTVSMGMSGTFPDSLWTAANFQNYQPISSPMGSAAFLRTMEKHYDSVEGERQFGDVLLVRRADGKGGIRSAVYIADDIVYTKNGRQLSRPWVLTELDRVMASAARNTGVELKVETWRRRPDHGSN